MKFFLKPTKAKIIIFLLIPILFFLCLAIYLPHGISLGLPPGWCFNFSNGTAISKTIPLTVQNIVTDVVTQITKGNLCYNLKTWENDPSYEIASNLVAFSQFLFFVFIDYLVACAIMIPIHKKQR